MQMPRRIAVLAIASALSGCAINADCAYGVVQRTESEPARCRSRAEYDAERHMMKKSWDDQELSSVSD